MLTKIKSLSRSPLAIVLIFGLLGFMAWDFSTRVFVAMPDTTNNPNHVVSYDMQNATSEMQIPPFLGRLLTARAERVRAVEANKDADYESGQPPEQPVALSGSSELEGVRVKASAIFISSGNGQDQFIALGSQQNVETGEVQPLRLTAGDAIGGYEVLGIDTRFVELYNPETEKRLILHVFPVTSDEQPLIAPVLSL